MPDNAKRLAVSLPGNRSCFRSQGENATRTVLVLWLRSPLLSSVARAAMRLSHNVGRL